MIAFQNVIIPHRSAAADCQLNHLKLRQLLQQRKDSPLNNREFCAQQGISEKSYYYWLKKLRESAMERGIPQLVALEDREKPDELRIEYHGASMVLPGHVDIDAVAAVLRSLQRT